MGRAHPATRGCSNQVGQQAPGSTACSAKCFAYTWSYCCSIPRFILSFSLGCCPSRGKCPGLSFSCCRSNADIDQVGCRCTGKLHIEVHDRQSRGLPSLLLAPGLVIELWDKPLLIDMGTCPDQPLGEGLLCHPVRAKLRRTMLAVKRVPMVIR